MTQEGARSPSPPVPLSAWADWWLTIECGCGRRTDYPINLLMREQGRDSAVSALAGPPRLRPG
jgi:hypothetical protein